MPVFLSGLQVKRRSQTAIRIKWHRSVLVDDPPAISVACQAKRLAHPKANGLVDPFLNAGHPHKAMAKRNVTADGYLEIKRFNPDGPIPCIQPFCISTMPTP